MSKLIKLLALGAIAATSAFAGTSTGNQAFGTFATEIISWVTGNLGYVIALFSFFGSLLIYAFTHKGSVIIIGIIIAILVGGGAGITHMFFEQGTNTFSSYATF